MNFSDKNGMNALMVFLLAKWTIFRTEDKPTSPPVTQVYITNTIAWMTIFL